MIKPATVEEIIQTARIEEVVGDFVTLKKRGANLMGLCPFHTEKTPSFTVSPAKGIFKCFGCGKAGNSVGFMMEHDSLSYPDALRYLARKYGIEIEEDEVNREQVMNEAAQRESLYVVLDYASGYFRKMLQEDPEGSTIGKSYFYERGFRDDTIEKFGLGYSRAAWRALSEQAQKDGFKREFLEKTGLVKVNEQGQEFDMFRDRVMFPIHNLSGRIVAFAGRQLKKDDKSPKYVNSPETEVYHKSDTLYGLYLAKQAIKKADKCFLVEGYTDVITLVQSGIENVVASSGTSLTEGQIKLIRRFTDNVTILYDGDPAGMKASLRGIDLLLAGGLNVRVATFPEGDDPDSYCRKVGGEAFLAYLAEHEKDFVFFKSELLFTGAGNDPIKKAEAIRDLVESIAKIPDPLKRSVYVKECSRIAGMDELLLLAELNKIRKKEAGVSPEPLPEERSALEQVSREIQQMMDPVSMEEQERAVIRLLIMFGEKPINDTTVARFVVEELAQDELIFDNAVYKQVFEELQRFLAENDTVPQSFFVNHPELSISSLAATILAYGLQLSEHWASKFEIFVKTLDENYQKDVASVLNYLRLRKVDTMLDEIQNELKTAAEEEQMADLQVRYMQLHALRQQLSADIGAVIVK